VRLCTFDAGAGPRTGLARGRWVTDLNALDPAVPADMKALLAGGADTWARVVGLSDACLDKSQLKPLDSVRLLPPVPAPGRYLDFYSFEGHVRKARARRGLDVAPEWYERPTYYNGNPYAFVGHGSPVRYPADEAERDYEMELAAVVSRPVRDLDAADWRSAVAGFTLLNDCSARQRQMASAKVGLGPAYGKDFGKALGPWIVTPDECPDPARIEVAARVNGEEWGRGLFGQARYGWGEMLAFATRDQDLRPGDVVGSGTFPDGCGYELGRFLEPGDVVELEMLYGGRSLGVLRNGVA
jgi:fumarylacetoacetate (FAA) hydrolase